MSQKQPQLVPSQGFWVGPQKKLETQPTTALFPTKNWTRLMSSQFKIDKNDNKMSVKLIKLK